MDVDFHYYVTYVAARAAGFCEQDSLVIAHCAEYVDESLGDRTKQKTFVAEEKRKKQYQPVQTVNPPATLDHIKHTTDKTALVWIPFHFLPGNFESKEFDAAGTVTGIGSDGLIRKKTTNGSYTLTEHQQWKLKMICTKNSDAAKDMMADTMAASISANKHPRDIQNHRLYLLCLLGVRMHVLADTYAHAGFAGFLSTLVNDVTNVTEIIQRHKPVQVRRGVFLERGPAIGEKDQWKGKIPVGRARHEIQRAPAAFGHGRIGTLPDRPSVRYRWDRPSDGSTFSRDNPVTYVEAKQEIFEQMKTILEQCTFGILKKECADAADLLKKMDSGFFEKLGDTKVFLRGDQAAKELRERCDKLRKHIKSSLGDDLLDYKGAKLADAFYKGSSVLELPERRHSLVYHFCEAARYHQDWTNEYMKKKVPPNGILNKKAMDGAAALKEVKHGKKGAPEILLL